MSNRPRVRQKPANSANGEMDFSSLVASRPKRAETTFQIDMSRFWPEKAEMLKQQAQEAGEEWNGLLFTYRTFRMNEMFDLQETVIFVKRQRPLWTQAKCLEVAMLATCHVDPPARAGASPDENRAMLIPLYCQTIETADDEELTLFHFFEEFNEKSGNFLKNLQAEIESRKKNSEVPKESPLSELSTSP